MDNQTMKAVCEISRIQVYLLNLNVDVLEKGGPHEHEHY